MTRHALSLALVGDIIKKAQTSRPLTLGGGAGAGGRAAGGEAPPAKMPLMDVWDRVGRIEAQC